MLLTDADVDAPSVAAISRTGQELNLPALDLDSGQSADNGLLFRSSATEWVYNLSTKDLEPGDYEIIVVTPEGLGFKAAFSLR